MILLFRDAQYVPHLYLNLLVHCFTFVFLAHRGTLVVSIVFGGELAAYILYKTLRRDFLFYIPVGSALPVLSLLYNIITKLLVDWMACLQLRTNR